MTLSRPLTHSLVRPLVRGGVLVPVDPEIPLDPSASVYPDYVAGLTPVLWARLNESSGTAMADSSGTGNGGTLVNPTPGVNVLFGEPGKVASDPANKSFYCNGYNAGTKAYINFGNNASVQIVGQITMAAWVSPEFWPATNGINCVIVSKGYNGTSEGYFLRLVNTSGVIKLQVGSYAASADYFASWDVTGWALNEWKHVTGLYDGTNWKLYINGTQVATNPTAGGARATTSNVCAFGEFMAAGSSTFQRGFVGRMDELMIFNYGLTPTQVGNLYNSSVAEALTLVSNTDTTVSLSYTPVTSGTAPFSSRLQRSLSQSSGYSYVGAAQAGTGPFTFNDTSAAPGTNYFYRVVTTDAASVVRVSNPLTVTTWTAQVAEYVARQFGMFIHFGMATFANVEWASPTTAANTFNPGSTLDVDQWLDNAKAAGMNYTAFTSKHHEGFAMWPSASQPHNITASSWYAANGSRNILMEYTTKARARGLGVGLYFSIDDRKWRYDHPGWTNGQIATFIQTQLTELLDGTYGNIDFLWMDGWGWFSAASGGEPNGSNVGLSFAQVPYATILNHVKGLQPDCVVVVNNHETGSLANTEIAEYEGGVVGQVLPAGNILPAEVCDTSRTDNRWFWYTGADTPLTKATVLATKASINANSATYLLNVPPDTTGVIPSEETTWMRSLGEDVTAPATPVGLSATPGSNQVTLQWTANTEPDLAYYTIWQASTSGGTYTQTGGKRYAYANPHTGTAIISLTGGTPVFFKILAVDYSGNASALTSFVTATPN